MARHAANALSQQYLWLKQNANETTARCASDAIAHQNMRRNQNDNEAIAQYAANAEQHHVQHQAEEAEV